MALKSAATRPKCWRAWALGGRLQRLGARCTCLGRLMPEAYEYFPHGAGLSWASASGWRTSRKLQGRAGESRPTSWWTCSTPSARSRWRAWTPPRRRGEACTLRNSPPSRTEVVGRRRSARARVGRGRAPAGSSRARGRRIRAAEQDGCHLGTLHPCHNTRVDESIGNPSCAAAHAEEGRKRRTGSSPRDVPKPKTPEEMVRNYRARGLNVSCGSAASAGRGVARASVPTRRRPGGGVRRGL